jgi:hypothetical protein
MGPGNREIEHVVELYGEQNPPSHPTKLEPSVPDTVAVNITELWGVVGNCAEQVPDATPLVIVQLIAFVVSFTIPFPLPKPTMFIVAIGAVPETKAALTLMVSPG